jgi:hypothetical protein
MVMRPIQPMKLQNITNTRLARDDERYMQARCVLKRMTKKMRIVYSVCHSCSGGWSVEASTTLMDRMTGIQWKMRNCEKLLS